MRKNYNIMVIKKVSIISALLAILSVSKGFAVCPNLNLSSIENAPALAKLNGYVEKHYIGSHITVGADSFTIATGYFSPPTDESYYTLPEYMKKTNTSSFIVTGEEENHCTYSHSWDGAQVKIKLNR